ncbi:MAG TPA: tetratricopeptide repeat protein [Candidatus Polarisedimenticolaceae bacterium]|nr:tetratricopeptide repeat protein [Candidatus Polarisedimenticolaceae bacterium]
MNSKPLGLLAAGILLAACGRGNDVEQSVVAESTFMPAATAKVDTDLPKELPVTVVDPVTAKKAWSEGVAAYESGSFAEAATKLDVAVSGRPGDAYAVYLLGLSRWKTGDLEGAEKALEGSLAIDAMRPKSWINLARVRMDRNDPKGALEAATKALEIDPQSSTALHQEGRALLALNRADEAEVSLLASRGFDPDDGYVANTLGLLLIQRGRFAEAIPHLEGAKAILPNVSYVRNNLGVAYEKTGRIDEARIEYQAALDAGDTKRALSSLNRLGPAPVATASTVAASE